MNRRALLAAEIGTGRGHVSRLRMFAAALHARGFRNAVGLTSLEHARELDGVASVAHAMSPLPYMHHLRAERGEGPASTYGEFLGDLGYFSPEIVARHVAAWRRLIEAERPDVVVCEQAPSALLAARSLGVASVVAGSPYSTPPAGLPAYPVLLPEFSARIWDEDALRDAVNAATAPLGLPALARLPELYAADLTLADGLALFDPYGHARETPLVGPEVGRAKASDATRGPRDEVFAYLSVDDRRDAAVIAMLISLPLPRRAFAPGCGVETAMLLRAHGVVLETAPVAPHEVARRSRLLFHAGNGGTMALGVVAALPQVSAPRQLEQVYNARRHAATGAGRMVPVDGRTSTACTRAVLDLYEDAAAAEAATALARAVATDVAQAPQEACGDAIVRLLA